MSPVRSHADAQLFASICQDGTGAPLLRRLERRNQVRRLGGIPVLPFFFGLWLDGRRWAWATPR